MVDPTHALSFGSVAQAYDRFRPGYPPPAVAWAVGDPPPGRVVDLGAGTGILTGERGLGGDPPRLRSFGAEFGPIEWAEFRHSTWHTADSLIAMMATRSYYVTATPDARREMDTAIRELTATHPELAGRDTFELPYRTTCYRARRH